MKNNKKGFISITIIYSFFLLFITIMLLIMYSYIHDRKMNNKIKSEIINNLKNKSPDIYLSLNGSSNPHPTYTVNVKILDGGNGIASAKYIWSTSMNTTPTTDFSSYDVNLTTPVATGYYYLIIKACDVNNTCKTVVSNYFNVGTPYLCLSTNVLHNETCTNEDEHGHCLNAGLNLEDIITQGRFGSPSVLNTGDAFDCDVNGDGDYDPNTERFYYISDFYSTTTNKYDNTRAVLVYYSNVHNGVANNTHTTSYTTGSNVTPTTAANELPTTSQWTVPTLINSTRNITSTSGGALPAPTVFPYTGNVQTFTAPYTGTYKLEVWGAQGGSIENYYQGGYGGYSKGEIELTAGDVLYVVVGGAGNGITGGYNGGGTATATCTPNNATHQNGGGGGGATHIATATGRLSDLRENSYAVMIVAGGGGGGTYHGSGYIGGSGGGQIGGSGSGRATADGGTQISGYKFGIGQDGGPCEANVYFSESGRGAGGGGWYGGTASQINYNGMGSGGGGSGFIATSKLSNKAMYCYNCTESTIMQLKTYSTTCVSEDPVKNCAKIGDGYAKITPVNVSEPTATTTSFAYTNKAARLPNIRELKDCISSVTVDTTTTPNTVHATIDMDVCSFLLENTSFTDASKVDGYLLETPYSDTNYVWVIDSEEPSAIGGKGKTVSNKYGVRPVIETEKSSLQPSI